MAIALLDCNVVLDVAHEGVRHAPDSSICAVSIVSRSKDNERLEEHQKAGDYFDRSGEFFDSLYSLERGSRIMRPINRIFRRDIYERYLLTIRHLREVQAQSVLDIGVGAARYAAGYLEAGVSRVVGVDISNKMLQFAREHVAGLEGAEDVFEFVHADVDEFQTEERFDVVVATGFFDYIPDTAASLTPSTRIPRTLGDRLVPQYLFLPHAD